MRKGVLLKSPPGGAGRSSRRRRSLVVLPAQALGAALDTLAQRDDLLNVAARALRPLHVNDRRRLEPRVRDEAVYAVAEFGARVTHLLLVVLGLRGLSGVAFGRAEAEVGLHPQGALPDLRGLRGDAAEVERAARDDRARHVVADDLYALEVFAELLRRGADGALVRRPAAAHVSELHLALLLVAYARGLRVNARADGQRGRRALRRDRRPRQHDQRDDREGRGRWF